MNKNLFNTRNIIFSISQKMFLYFVIEYDLLMFKFYPNVIHLEDVNTFIWNGWPVDMNKYHEWGIDIDVFNPCVKYS